MEKYLLERAKCGRNSFDTESWMIIAKTIIKGSAAFEIDVWYLLQISNFFFQIAAYRLHLDNGRMRDAADSLCNL
jgi:hypothetical protein